ncbi:MAG: LysR family transcriptional regulator [Pelosinus sp.]|nr:LysR family transcriptional regulator [Pelosinus sp.]
MQLRQMEYFQMVSKMKSVTKAAELLNVSQPSVTVAIKKLEEELGVSLFDRNFKKLVLTREGQIFLKRTEKILSAAQYALDEMRDCKAANKVDIKIGITPIVGAMIFPDIFEKFLAEYPHCKVKFSEEGSLMVRELLQKGALDLGILITSNIAPELEKIAIATEQIHVCFAANHPLHKVSAVPFRELSKYSFLLFKEDTYIRQMILDECERHQFIPNIGFSSRQIETILGLVEKGVGISFLPEVIIKKHANIRSCPLAEPLFIQVGIAWNSTRYQSNVCKTLVDFIARKF